MYDRQVITKLFPLVLLCLYVLCMVPLMGGHHVASGHLQHDASTSCSTCMGSAAMNTGGMLFIVLGLLSLIVSAAPPLTLVADQFHPPRTR